MKRIPKKWPCGHWYIKIVQVPPAQMVDICGNADGAWAIGLADETDMAGTIYIDADMDLAMKWSTLYHELVHAFHDINYYYARYGPPKETKDD